MRFLKILILDSGWTSMETRNIAINFDVCNQGWKLAEILSHESFHSRTGKRGLSKDQALKYDYDVRKNIFPCTGRISHYGKGWR